MGERERERREGEREREGGRRERGERERGEREGREREESIYLHCKPVVSLSQVHVTVSSSQYQLVNIKEKEEGGKEIIAKDSN